MNFNDLGFLDFMAAPPRKLINELDSEWNVELHPSVAPV